MGSIKSLAKDTAIYGLSSIIGRFLNWCLVPLYTNVFQRDEYGVVTFVYSAIAIALVVLTYGMETGFFRFANHKRWSDPMQVYSTALLSLAVTSTLFCVLVAVFLQPISVLMECGGHASYVMMMAVCVAVDAFSCLPFSYLRYKNKAVRFASLKMLNIGLNIGLNLFFILLCPWLMRVAPATVSWFYVPDFGIGYIFLANLIATLVMLVMLTPELQGFRWSFCGKLWVEMIRYSSPLLVLGIAGIMNQTIGNLLFPSLYPGSHEEVMGQLGIYGANYKIAIVMVMFIQAFRFAYEPFIFAQSKEHGDDSRQSYAEAMKYFIIMALFIFLGVMYYLDILKYFISPRYFSGLAIVPILMLAEFFFGVHFNLSVWYKLTDRTSWGAWFSLIGLAVTIALNVLLVPTMSYHGCAWAAFFCYLSMMLISYFIGQHYYYIKYPLLRIGGYLLLTIALYVLGIYVINTPSIAVNFALRAILLGIYGCLVMRIEHISPSSIVKPIISKIRR